MVVHIIRISLEMDNLMVAPHQKGPSWRIVSGTLQISKVHCCVAELGVCCSGESQRTLLVGGSKHEVVVES